MNISILRCLARALVFCALTGLLSGCVATVGEYYDGGDIGAGYYDEPYGVIYENWGPGYHVAPFRGGDHRDQRPTREGREEGHSSTRAYRTAPASHSMPSIPSQPRSGGSHPGGSHSR